MFDKIHWSAPMEEMSHKENLNLLDKGENMIKNTTKICLNSELEIVQNLEDIEHFLSLFSIFQDSKALCLFPVLDEENPRYSTCFQNPTVFSQFCDDFPKTLM